MKLVRRNRAVAAEVVAVSVAVRVRALVVRVARMAQVAVVQVVVAVIATDDIRKHSIGAAGEVHQRFFFCCFSCRASFGILPIRDIVLAKPNYSFEKRQRDLEKKRKQEEKRLRKLAGKKPEDGEDDQAESGDGVATTDAGTVDAAS